MPLRLGVFGGTFDPIHLGHLRAAEEALDMLSLDEMLFVPAALPPHKPGRKIVPFESRWDMLRLAIADNSRFRLSDIEKRMSGKSYTVHSLTKLHEENPGAEIFFLVGRDAFFEMDTWYKYEDIFRLAGIAVLGRPECGNLEILDILSQKVSALYKVVSEDGEIGHPELRSVYGLRNTLMDISSTRIRELAAEGRSVRYLVPDSVLGYIVGNRLYHAGR